MASRLLPVILALLLTLVLLYTSAPSLSPFRSPPSPSRLVSEHPTLNVDTGPGADPPASHEGKRSVAIVGAGAAGSSAAFWLSRAAREAGVEERGLEVVIYEKEGYYGGRSTTVYPYGDLTLPPIELGASIFVPANRNLMRAVTAFNLSLIPFLGSSKSVDADDGTMGIWDGRRFLVRTNGGVGWWDKAKLLWRYGYAAPTRTEKAVERLKDGLGVVYNASWVAGEGGGGGWETVEEMSGVLGFDGLTRVSVREYLVGELGIGELWVDEMVEAATRVNYAQDTPSLHALVGMVSLAAAGATSVLGGNWQIFRGFAEASGAEVRLGTMVTSVKAAPDGRWIVTTNSTAGARSAPHEHHQSTLKTRTFDAVIYAAPPSPSTTFHLPPSSVLPPRSSPPLTSPPYVHLHVTLLVTTAASPRPEFFGLGPNDKVPLSVLTTASTHRAEGGATAVPLPEFQSITYHGELAEGSGEWVVKIFSLTRRSDAWLARVFGAGEGDVLWVLRKEWDSYPVLPPRTTFPPLRPLGRNSSLLMTAGQETWVSTMETQTLAGRNAVGVLAREWWGLEGGVCGGVVEGGWDWTC